MLPHRQLVPTFIQASIGSSRHLLEASIVRSSMRCEVRHIITRRQVVKYCDFDLSAPGRSQPGESDQSSMFGLCRRLLHTVPVLRIVLNSMGF